MARMGKEDKHAAFRALVILHSTLAIAYNCHFHVAFGAKANFVHSNH